jgi:hypothetical protein
MRHVAVVIGLVAAFWAGYALCAYRAYSIVFPTLSESWDVSNASRMIQFADLIDHGSAVTLRAKLLAVAKISTDSVSAPLPGYSFKAFLRGPLESTTEALEVTRQSTASQLITARTDIARLCSTSPATDTYRYVCGR